MTQQADPMPLIKHVAKRFPWWLRDELLSAGLVGYARALATYREGTVPLAAYIAMKVRYEMQDFCRTWHPNSRTREAPTFVEVSWALPDRVESVEQRLCREGELEHKLRALTPRLRMAVELRLEGVKVMDIAVRMRVSQGRVTQLVTEAIAQMREAA